MAQMISKKYTLTLLISIILLLQALPTKACGFYEDESDYTAMMFRAQVGNMYPLWPFLYTMRSLYYNYYSKETGTDLKLEDRLRNCEEWLKQCDKTVKIEDIYTIQYETDGFLYMNSADNGKLNDDFKKNTFVQFLLVPSNKDLLDYMYFAKMIETVEVGSDDRFESWDYNNYNYREIAKLSHTANMQKALQMITKVKSEFLKQRYAFQICRSAYYSSNYAIVNTTYEQYFSKADSKSLMRAWSTLFRAMTTDVIGSKMEANRYYSQTFMSCDGKNNRCVSLFNPIDSITDPFSGYTPQEISIAQTILALKNPGKALQLISDAYANDKKNPYIPFLIMREINKLEDWMITPLFYGKYSITNDDPFRCAYYDQWYEQYKKETQDEEKIEDQRINIEKDKIYLSNVKSSILEFLPSSTDEARDFYYIALAHLSLLQENATDARKYLSLISEDANPTIQLQKHLEIAWLSIKTEDIQSNSFKKTFLNNIVELEKIEIDGYDSIQMLYTLTLSLANEYFKKSDRVTGNLLRLKSDYYARGRNSFWYDDYATHYFFNLAYFDYNATIEDMDKLIHIIEKKKKDKFEIYLLDQQICAVNAYKDLKGTIAFRNNNLQLAYETFASMPQDYWTIYDGISYQSALNEDPFVPKGIGKQKDRRFDYVFNKTQFVKTLLDVENRAKTEQNDTKKAECYITLANAYYNTTYNGNSWMMMRYNWSWNDSYYSKTDCLPEWMQDYMTGKRAAEYYKKALAISTKDEQKAFSNLMLYVINRNKFNLANIPTDSVAARNYALDLKKLKSTNVFIQYGCPSINSFIAAR